MNEGFSDVKYLDTAKFYEIEFNYEELSENVSGQHVQFVANTITMANHWIGEAGDSFLAAANTMATYLGCTMSFYDRFAGVLGNYQFEFKAIDDVLKKDVGVEEK